MTRSTQASTTIVLAIAALATVVGLGLRSASNPATGIWQRRSPPRDPLEAAFARHGQNAVPLLRQKLQGGSADERARVVYLFREHKIFDLFPDVVAAVSDNTSYNRARYATHNGGGFVGAVAAASLERVARSMGFDIEAPGHRQSFVFYNDFKQRLKEPGAYPSEQAYDSACTKARESVRNNTARLREVQSSWEKWWKKNRAKAETGPHTQPVLEEISAGKDSGGFTVTLTGPRRILAGSTIRYHISLTNISTAPIIMDYRTTGARPWVFDTTEFGVVDAQGVVDPKLRAGLVAACPVGAPPRSLEPSLQPGEKRWESTWYFPNNFNQGGIHTVRLSFRVTRNGALDSITLPLEIVPISKAMVERAIAARWQPDDAAPNQVLQSLWQGKWAASKISVREGTVSAHVTFAAGYKYEGFKNGWYRLEPEIYPSSDPTGDQFANGYKLEGPAGTFVPS